MNGSDDPLYGRNRAVSRQLVVLAVGLLVLLAATFYTDVNTLWPLPLAESGAVLLVALAGTEAYYNEGLLVAWTLTFAAALPAFVFHPPRGPTFAVTPATAPTAVATALGVALALGSIGFGLGTWLRRRRDRRHGERYEPSESFLPVLLVGRDRRVAGRWIVGETGFSLLVFGLVTGGGIGGSGAGIVSPILFFLGPATLHAERNGGLATSWLLVFIPIVTLMLPYQLAATGMMYSDRPVLYAVGTAAFYGIPGGTLAYVVGGAIGRVRRHLQRLGGPKGNSHPQE